MGLFLHDVALGLQHVHGDKLKASIFSCLALPWVGLTDSEKKRWSKLPPVSLCWSLLPCQTPWWIRYCCSKLSGLLLQYPSQTDTQICGWILEPGWTTWLWSVDQFPASLHVSLLHGKSYIHLQAGGSGVQTNHCLPLVKWNYLGSYMIHSRFQETEVPSTHLL